MLTLFSKEILNFNNYVAFDNYLRIAIEVVYSSVLFFYTDNVNSSNLGKFDIYRLTVIIFGFNIMYTHICNYCIYLLRFNYIIKITFILEHSPN